MATIDEVNTAVDTLSTDVDAKLAAIAQEITDLKNAGGATPAQLDALLAKVQAVDTKITGFTA